MADRLSDAQLDRWRKRGTALTNQRNEHPLFNLLLRESGIRVSSAMTRPVDRRLSISSSFASTMTLPQDMLATANRESKEEAWRPTDFPGVLERASLHCLACVGGQFQFRGPIGTAEMYWLNAVSKPQNEGEKWDSYVARANSEVLSTFTRLVEQIDFHAEARQWKHINQAMENGVISDPMEHLFFVAYFNQRPESARCSE